MYLLEVFILNTSGQTLLLLFSEYQVIKFKNFWSEMKYSCLSVSQTGSPFAFKTANISTSGKTDEVPLIPTWLQTIGNISKVMIY